MTKEKNDVKVIIPYLNEIDQCIEYETLWANKSENKATIENIPFFAVGLAYKDIIAIEFYEGMYYYNGLVLESGNSTIRVLSKNITEIEKITSILVEKGCGSEINNMNSLMSINVPKQIKYKEIIKFLDDLFREGIIDYEEACIGTISKEKRKAYLPPTFDKLFEG